MRQTQLNNLLEELEKRGVSKAQLNNLIGELEKRAEHWRALQDDPHGISIAVYVTLMEVAELLKAAMQDDPSTSV